MGINGCQGTPWSEELDGKELHGALGGECGLEPRGSPSFPVHGVNTGLPSIYKNMWYFVGFQEVVF